MTPDSSIRLVFLGTPMFSVPTLQALIEDSSIEIMAVVTPLDKPAGRGQKLTPPAVKAHAEKAGIPVYQTKSIRKDSELQQTLKNLAPDFFITVAFGQILSQEVLDIPKRGTVNVHASLLPELRGANPIQWAILQNKTETGITTMLTDIGVDTGDMLLMEKTPIGPDDTLGELAIRMSALGGPLLIKTLKGLVDGSVKPVPQDHEKSTHAPKCDKHGDVIDWGKDARTVHNQIRAFNGGVAFLSMPDGSTQRVKLSGSHVVDIKTADIKAADVKPEIPGNASGRILGIIKEDTEDRLRIVTGHGAVDIRHIQPEGKRAMSIRDWVNGVLRGTLEENGMRFSATSSSVPV